MAGHSKWANIKHRKAAQDAKRGKIFTKLIREIVVAAKMGGADQDSNPRLRDVVSKALSANMKRDTVDNAIKRGAGADDNENYDEIRYEGYGPSGVAVMVECLTDNRNRTVSEVRHAFTKSGGNLGTDGSVSYLFTKQGMMTYPSGSDEDAIMEAALEAGADDIASNDDGSIEVTTAWEELTVVKEAMVAAGHEPETADVIQQAATSVDLELEDAEKVMRLIDMLEDLGIVAYKVGSGELTNWPLLKYIAKTGKPMIISTGMSTLEEIKESIVFVKGNNNQLAVLQCTSTYPCAYENVNLNVINVLKNKFNVIAGLSDHSEGIYTSLAAIALGADIIEKHFTIDRNLPGPDQRASIEPYELKDLVKGARAIELALGSTKKVIDEEIAVQRMARESVVSLVEILENSIIESNMVGVKRPGTGIPAKLLDEIIGKKATKTIKAGVLLSWNDLV